MILFVEHSFGTLVCDPVLEHWFLSLCLERWILSLFCSRGVCNFSGRFVSARFLGNIGF